jgi:hypothetical protein
MTGTGITYDGDGYAQTPQGQAYRLYVEGKEPVTDADRDWFAAFRAEEEQEAIFSRQEEEAERIDQESRGIPWADGPDRLYDLDGVHDGQRGEAEADA